MTPEERQLLLAMARMMRSRVTAVELALLDRHIKAITAMIMQATAQDMQATAQDLYDRMKALPTSTPPTGEGL